MLFLATSHAAAQLTPVKIGHNAFTDETVFYLGRDVGIFKKHGIHLEPIYIPGGSLSVQALIGNSLDMLLAGGTPLVYAVLKGADLKYIAGLNNRMPYVLVAREGINTPEQLRGKKVGINRLGGKSSLVLRVMLEDAGLNTAKDVTLLQLGGSQERLAALVRGGIDAAPVDFAFEPKMKQMGFHLVPSKKTAFMNGPITVTVANLKANRGKWLRFVKANMEATYYMTVNKSGAMDVLKKIIQIDERETLEHAYEQMRARATVDLIAPDAAIENLVKMMTYVDNRAAGIDRSKLTDYSIVRELIQSNAVPVKR